MTMKIEQLYQIFQWHPVISTDSRNCPQGAIFFALKGDRFDGNDYVQDVLAAGAVFVVADGARVRLNAPNIIKVDNVLHTLQRLAHYHRTQMPAKVIAITGTNGKTTTKELIAAALSAKYQTLYTQGNLNNHIGVPLTLLRLTPKDRYAVIEMGANHPGEIRDLCVVADPDCGLITNVGKAHLEGFGSFEGVVRTKTELYDYLRSKNAPIFANTDNPVLKEHHRDMRVVYYGSDAEASIHGHVIEPHPTLQIEWTRGEATHVCQTQLVGAYNLENVLAAICVASRFDVPDDAINAALAAYTPTNNRSQILKTKFNTVIVDAYNANPSSMQAALENFKQASGSPKMVILGEMKELGAYNRKEHKKIVDWLRDSAEIAGVLLVGKSFEKCSDNNPFTCFETTAGLLAHLQQRPVSGCSILVKGSRANGLEAVIPFL
ncbi:UDP-N-acetylmuramoyl-tripeptide--D-alanyl-D-alanine ligase [Bacteroidia bacterium]|nr:UDP-N-acetylmuramoyl-tripeptide--D-alanyl-D-alanine ligase [Bacteroidia bacterium]